jgi:hypothetical protein
MTNTAGLLGTDDNLMSLSVLSSGRYSSKAQFSSSYIKNNCPILYCDQLSHEELQIHINRVNFIVCVLNKLLGKPKSALLGFSSLIQTVYEDSQSESAGNISTNVDTFDDSELHQIYKKMAGSLLTIKESSDLQLDLSKISKISNKEKKRVLRFCFGESALCYSYSSQYRKSIITLLTYLLSSPCSSTPAIIPLEVLCMYLQN